MSGPTSLALKLARREALGPAAGAAADPFAFRAVPRSGQHPIEALLDESSDLKSVVLLGFTRDGLHLVSYTTQPVAAADGQEGYCLQLWSFSPGARCRRLFNVPLFRTQPYLDALGDEDEFMAADDMLLTIAETPDSSLLVVHGRSADPGEASRERLPNYLTLIPGPLHAGAAQLQVAHLAYHTAYPHVPAFNPYHAVMQAEDASASSAAAAFGGATAVALCCSDGVRYVHASVGRQAMQLAAAGQRAQVGPSSPGWASPASRDGGEDDSSSSTFPSPQPPAAGSAASRQPPSPAAQHRASSPAVSSWPQQGPRRQPQVQSRSPAAEGAGGDGSLSMQWAVISCAHASGRQPLSPCSSGSAHGMAAVSCTEAAQHLDLEACIYAALQQQGLPPAALLDYAPAPVQACSWRDQQGLLVLVILRLARQQQQQQQQVEPGGTPLPGAPAREPPPPPPQQQQQQGSRSACLLLHASASSGAGCAVEWLEPPYPWHEDLSAFLVQQTAFAGLAFDKAPAFFADFMRSRWSPPPPRWSLPLVLSNRSVLGTGRSLGHITHPWLPQAILGYISM